MPHPDLTIYHNSFQQFIAGDFEIETLANDCQFTEGPVWNSEGFYLFSDITANCIYKIAPGSDKEIFLQNSGTENPEDEDLKSDQAGSNGLAYDQNSDLLICRHGSHCIAKYDGNQILPIVTEYNDKPFNSPNDLILHSSGKLFFSDPPYGLRDGKLNPQKFQPVAGVYCLHNGIIELICDKYQYPNGVCLSPDEKILYICSNKPFEKFISSYNAISHQFIEIVAEENSDGIECDDHGNIYLCNKDGIIILNESGVRMALLQLPTVPANLCRGGDKLQDLFITARQNIFLIRNFFK